MHTDLFERLRDLVADTHHVTDRQVRCDLHVNAAYVHDRRAIQMTRLQITVRDDPIPLRIDASAGFGHGVNLVIRAGCSVRQ